MCGASVREYVRKRRCGREWIIDHCRRCGHGFVRNRPTLEELRGFYAGLREEGPRRPLTVDALRNRPDCSELVKRIAALTAERSATLDVGCGRGGFSFHLAEHGFAPLTMIDLNPDSAEATRIIPNSTFKLSSFEDFTDRCNNHGTFSAIVMSQVLEHALDPLDWLRRMRDLLSPDGVAALALPNFAGVYRLLGRRDPFLIPPFHLNYFTPRSLRAGLAAAGLDVPKMETTSCITVCSDARRSLSRRRMLLGRLWNSAAWALNSTRFGIILRAYARRAPR
jgi:2-polyprenyl-3-methyl-5-hydroxy-6-metoxy-1,4-benzoquinol methylase